MSPARIVSPKWPRRGVGPKRDIVVNVQGDEPLIPPVLIDQVAHLLAEHRGAHIATLATKIEQINDLQRCEHREGRL